MLRKLLKKKEKVLIKKAFIYIESVKRIADGYFHANSLVIEEIISIPYIPLTNKF